VPPAVQPEGTSPDGPGNYNLKLSA